MRYSGRGALFVVKAGAATGWQGRGFTKDGEDTIKDFALNVTIGSCRNRLCGRACHSAERPAISIRNLFRDSARPADDQVLVLPLLLKEKVAALVYADAGIEPGGKMDTAALELLVLATSAWLEVASLRKQAQKEESRRGARREN